MHAEESEAGETNPSPHESDLVRIAAGKPKMVHPQTTTGKKSSEAVEERQVGGGCGRKIDFFFRIFKISKYTLLLSNPQLPAARGCCGTGKRRRLQPRRRGKNVEIKKLKKKKEKTHQTP